MKASINVIKSLFDCSRIGDIPIDELDLSGQVLAVSTRQIIEYAHWVPLVQQRVYEMRPQEPCTASHENTSHPRSLRLLRKRRLAALTKIGLHPSSSAPMLHGSDRDTTLPPRFLSIAPAIVDVRGALELIPRHLLLITVSTHGIPPFHSGEKKNQG